MLKHQYKIAVLVLLGLILFITGAYNKNIFFLKSLNSDNFNKEIVSNIDKELISLADKIDQSFRIIESNSKPLVDFKFITSTPQVSYYKIYNNQLVDWSNSEYSLPISLYGVKIDGYASFENYQGIFLTRKYFTADGYELVALFPIKRIYSIENEFLNDDIKHDFISEYQVKVSLSSDPETRVIKANTSNELFYISSLDPNNIEGLSYWIRLAILLLGSICIFSGFFIAFKNFETNKKYLSNFVLLLIGLLLLRFLLLAFKLPSQFFEIDIFKPTYFASSVLLPSFGDYILNVLSVFVLLLYFFLRIDSLFIEYLSKVKYSSFKRLIILLILTFFIGVCFYLFHKSLYVLHKDSQWIFDVTKSLSLNLYTISYIILFCLLSTVFFFVSYLLIRMFCVVSNIVGEQKIVNFSFLLLALVPLFFIGVSWGVITCYLLYLVVIVYFKLYVRLKEFNFRSYLLLIISSFTFSIIGSLILQKNLEVSDHTNKKKYAMSILDNNDLEMEYLLGKIANSIKSDSLVLKTLPNIWTTKDAIINRVKNEYIGHEFKRYNVDVHLFDRFGNAYFKNSIEDSYFDLRKSYTKKQYSTTVENLYHLTIYGSVLQDKYVQFIQVKYKASVVGYIVIDLVLKKIKENSLYPLLVNNYETNKQLLLSGYDFAIYEHGKLVYNYGDYSYPEIRDANKSTITFNEGGFNHYQTRLLKGKQVVISSPNNFFNTFLANFSYLFIVLIFCVFCALLFVSLYNKKRLSNFSTKIQIYLNLACFLPLIIVSISTMSVLSDNYKEESNNHFINKAQHISGNIDEFLDRYQQKQMPYEEMVMLLNKISEYTSTDINVFGIDGKLISSTQNAIYDLGLLSDLINPKAKKRLSNQNTVALISEDIGDFQYRSVYLNLQSPTNGNQIGLLSVPFFNSENEINSKRVAVLTTYMNVFSIAFILILVLSQVAYQSITRPLQLISDKLKRISFTGVNEKLKWNSEDEIGLLVTEYNNMLHKLEESKKALSKSEKEFAWREMAQQVAHEIKNPLTPMKLSMQHMRRVGVEDPEKLRSSIDSILSQIDTLNDIASSFSSFAKMPIPELKQYNLKLVCTEIISLYENNDDVIITYKLPEFNNIIVLGDDKIMGRILTNLVLNGIQAYSGNEKPKIEIVLSILDEKVLLKVKDNGGGIPDEVQPKVFLPNFSTKYTGSGIGLALAKRGVEHAQGEIWFETKANEGTSFLIELPLIKKD